MHPNAATTRAFIRMIWDARGAEEIAALTLLVTGDIMAETDPEDPPAGEAPPMVTDQLYRERAKEARQEAEAAKDPERRRQLLEIARAYEHFADLPGKTPWHVEKVEQNK